MKKQFHLPILALSLAAFLSLATPLKAAEISSANFCNMSPAGVSSGPVTLDKNCVIYENYNGASNGDLTVSNASLTVHHNLVWYPGYKINVVNGGRIFMNAGAKIRQTRLCVKDADGDGYGDVTGMKDNAGNPIPGSSVKQLDMVAADDCYKLPGYRPREAMFNLAYVDQDDSNPVAQNNVISDRELISLGFEVNTVNDPSAIGNPIRLVGDNLFVCTDTACTGATPAGFGNLVVQGKVGVGTGSPKTALDVTSSADVGAAGGGAVNVGGASDYIAIDSNEIQAVVGGGTTSATLHLQTDGGQVQVGLNNAALSTFRTYGNSYLATGAGQVGIGTVSPAYQLHLYKASGENGALFSLGANNMYLSHGGWSMGANKLGIGDGSNPNLVVDSVNDRVGINAISPAYNLTVNGSIGTPDMNNPYLVLDSSSSGGNNAEQSAQISLGESGRGGAALHLAYTGDGYSYIGMGALDANNLPTYYAMRFYYTNRDIYMPGSVSIGGNQGVTGSMTSGSVDTGRIRARVAGVSIQTGNSSQLEISNAANGAANISFHREGAYGAHFGLDTDNWFSTQGWSAGSGYTSMRVGSLNATGNITVSNASSFNASPTSYGTLGMITAKGGYYGILLGQTTSNPNLMYDGSGNGGVYYENGGWLYYTLKSNLYTGFGTTSPGYKLHVAGTFYASGSSRRFKENIKPLEIDSSKIYELEPVSYDYKKEYKEYGYIHPSGREVGLIAEDTAKVIPELGIMLDGKISNVDYGKLPVLLLNEVKKHENTIKDLKAQNQSLEDRLKSLEEKINKLTQD